MDNQNTINEIRSKIDIVELIGQYVPLVKKGQYYWGVCPFHNDKNPSMSVDPKRQTYNCWSCHNSGNVFNFIEQIENIDFKEALKLLGSKVGIDIGKTTTSSYDKTLSKYYDIYDLSSKYYSLMLSTESGKLAKEYLKKRGIDNDIIKEFGIGLATSSKDSLVNYLKEKKYDINTLNTLGLANGNNDMYINRIMFPLDDRNGKIVGFSGRIYDDSKLSKYMNTKETPIFKKGSCLYHYAKAKEHVREKRYVIVMEGFMDVIRASTIGVKNTIALMGTALTDEQISLIKKLSLNVYLCLDGDEPGQNADLHNGELLEKAGLNVKVVCLKDDEDPDSYIIKYGKEKFISLVESAINYSDFKIERLRNGINFASDLEVANYVNNVLKETSKITDKIRIEIILKKLASETKLSYNTLEKKLNEYVSSGLMVSDKDSTIPKKDVKYDKYIRACLEFIYYMIINPKVIKVYESEKVFFINSKMRLLAGEISYYYHKYGNIVIADFYTYLNDKNDLLGVYEEVLKVNVNDEITDETIFEYVKVIDDYNIKEEIKRLDSKMRSCSSLDEKIAIAEKIRLLKIGGEEYVRRD